MSKVLIDASQGRSAVLTLGKDKNASEVATTHEKRPLPDARPIPETFTRDGFTFEQVKRELHKAIYKQTKGDMQPDYEVIKIRQSKPHPKATHGFDWVESYPSSEQWGTYGWSFTSREDAERKFQSL